MKLKKVLAMVLCVAMVLGTMGTVVFADATTYEVTNNVELADAISNAVDGDIIKLAAGEYTGGISIGDEITLEGSVDADGNPTTVFSGENDASGSYYDYSIYMNKGTIKNIKIINAWKGIMTEGAGSLTIDNVTMVKIAYGIHIAEAKNAEDTVLIQNSNIDVTWACSFTSGPYALVITNNVFTSIEPYYTNGTGTPAVNSLVENTTVKDNYFDENTKIAVRADFSVGTNYYADGVENALHHWSEEDATIDTYYADEEMKETKITPKGTLNSCRVNVDNADRTFITTELHTIYAENSIKLEILDENENVIATTLSTDKVFEDITFPTGSLSIFTGINSTDDYWTTTWTTQMLRGDIEPDKAILYVDGIKTSEIDFVMKGATSNKDIVWSEVSGVFNPFVHSTYLGGTYDNAYLCVEVYDFYLGETFEVKYFSNGEHIATASLKEGMLTSGAKGSIGCCLGFNGDFDEYWATEWIVPANAEQIPDRVEAYVDGVKIAEKDCTFGNGIKGWDPASNGNWLYALINEDWIKIDGVHTAAKIGEKGYSSVKAAIADAEAQGLTNVEIEVFDDFLLSDIVLKNNSSITDLTITGNGDVTMDVEDKLYGLNNKNYVLNNLTVSGMTRWQGDVYFADMGLQSGNVTFNDCTLNGLYTLYQGKFVFDGCVINGETNKYSIMVYASKDVTFTDCVFNSDNKAIKVFGYGTFLENAQVNISGTEFYASATENVKAVVEMDLTQQTNPAVDLTIEDSFALGFAEGSETGNVWYNVELPAGKTDENISSVVTDSTAYQCGDITVAFENATDADGKEIAGLYNIVLNAADGADIYEFVSAELTFANTSKTVAIEDMNYEILGISGTTNAEKSIEKADTYALRLVDGAERMTGSKLVIGQVKFYGQGDINFTVSEGKVVTTQYGTNLGQYYTVDEDVATEDNLIVEGITNGAVEEVTRDVVVNVAFNHNVRDIKYWDNDKFTVTVKDGFGNVVTKDLEITSAKAGACSFNVKLAEDAGRLTVTLEAPGYRKYVYNTTVEPGTDPLVLNFWNDIKRETVQSPLAEIEEGVSGETNKNFVVGDIVMDYTVDEYDLAAVTSYYGMYELEDADKYIKYDLNRDGNIDIIDVHYVLHTLNN